MFSFKVHSNLWYESVVLTFFRGHRLEIKGPSALKGEETSFQEVEGVTELALNAQKVCKVDQTLMMVEVPVQKVHQHLYIISPLHSLKLLL